MIADLIVGLTLLLAAGFVTAWALRPDLRAWIERPKHYFQDALRGYDRARRPDGGDERHPE